VRGIYGNNHLINNVFGVDVVFDVDKFLINRINLSSMQDIACK
jgi:hypothetical protein